MDFSYGVTVWEILTRAIPFQGMKQAVIINSIFEGNPTLAIPERSPDAIRDILKGQSISEISSYENQATQNQIDLIQYSVGPSSCFNPILLRIKPMLIA